MKFEKWQALGNDYVIVEAAALPWELTAERVQRICDPHFGVGSDGILLLVRAARRGARRRPADLQPGRLRGRAVGQRRARGGALPAARAAGPTPTSSRSGPRPGRSRPTITSERDCTLEMGRASTSSKDFPGRTEDGRGELEAGGRDAGASSTSRSATRSARSRSRDGLEELDLPAIGPEIENHELFPNRTNVSLLPRRDGEGQPGPRADLRARGGGDALLGDRRQRRGGRRRPGGRRQPAHRGARRRRARGRGRATTSTCG